MRVTQNQLTRQYLQNSSSALENMSKINNKVLTQRKFLRASEDSVGAAKALIIRRNLEKCEMYKNNLDTAEGIFATAEKSMLNISDLSKNVTDSILYGVNGTQGTDEKKVIAGQIMNMAREMISQANSEFADRKLFGGTNNSTTPFVYDEGTGELTFNGVDINTDDSALFPQTKGIYVDVGMGMKFDATGNVDKQTVMDISLNGAKLLGHGVDANGQPKNLIAAAIKAAKAIEAGDTGAALDLLEKVKDATSTLMIGVTNIGNQQQSVEYSRSRTEGDEFNLKVSQKSVEGVSLEEEITNYKVAEMAYNATLSMGSKVIPKSIFDFI